MLCCPLMPCPFLMPACSGSRPAKAKHAFITYTLEDENLLSVQKRPCFCGAISSPCHQTIRDEEAEVLAAAAAEVKEAVSANQWRAIRCSGLAASGLTSATLGTSALIASAFKASACRSSPLKLSSFECWKVRASNF